MIAEEGRPARSDSPCSSTISRPFGARPGLYLEDLFVRPEFRGQGIGKALIANVARVAVGRGSGRLEWSVLDWNAPSIAFYRSQGAEPVEGWTIYRIADAALKQLAEKN